MANITYRLEAGRKLTNAEVDGNFRALNNELATTTQTATNAAAAAQQAQQSADTKQPASPKLTAIASAVWAANSLLMASGANTLEMLATGAKGRELLAATTDAVARSAIGLGNVNNTSDADKPISNATQIALNGKVDKEAGKGLSTNDYTAAEKTKLSGISAGATANSTDAQLRDRSTHTGTQTLATISDAGTAAKATLTATTTDSTIGRVLKVGDAGILGDAPRITNLNTTLKGGSYSYASGATGAPAGAPFGVVDVKAYDSQNIVQKIDRVGSSSIFSYVRSTTNGGTSWNNWIQELNTLNLTASTTDPTIGQLLKVGDYGIGANVPNLTAPNLNSLTVPPGSYFVAEPTNGPTGITFYGFLDWKVRSETESQRLTYVGTGAIRTFERIKTDNATGWRGWVETTPFGFGQVVRDMTASRALNVTYTNNTGRAIQISVSCGPSTAATQVVALFINGADVTRGTYSTGPGQYLNAMTIVPPGANYSAGIAGVGGTLEMFAWRELS